MSADLERVEAILQVPMIPAAPGGLPTRPYVTLTEALTWIAFGVALDTAAFYVADEYGIGPFGDRGNLITVISDAASRFSEKASGGLLEVRGRYLPNFWDHSAAANADTRHMSKDELRDFARFDCLHGGLERGEGPPWEALSLDRMLHGPGDGWRNVEIARVGLLIGFQPGPRWRPQDEYLISWCEEWLTQGKGTGEKPAWAHFREVPAHAGLSRDDVFRPAFRAAKTKQTNR